MLNPSTADALVDDATIRKCIQIAKYNKFGSMSVGNMYAYRSTDPKNLMALSLIEAIGPDNHNHLLELVEKSEKIIVGWGRQGRKGTYMMQKISTIQKRLLSRN